MKCSMSLSAGVNRLTIHSGSVVIMHVLEDLIAIAQTGAAYTTLLRMRHAITCMPVLAATRTDTRTLIAGAALESIAACIHRRCFCALLPAAAPLHFVLPPGPKYAKIVSSYCGCNVPQTLSQCVKYSEKCLPGNR